MYVDFNYSVSLLLLVHFVLSITNAKYMVVTCICLCVCLAMHSISDTVAHNYDIFQCYLGEWSADMEAKGGKDV